jgi:hypothetical protein
MAWTFLEMDKANMRRARFGGGINAGFGAKTANFDLSVHIGRNSRPFHFRHAELVLALPAFGSSIHRAAATHISLGKMDPETSSG